MTKHWYNWEKVEQLTLLLDISGAEREFCVLETCAVWATRWDNAAPLLEVGRRLGRQRASVIWMRRAKNSGTDRWELVIGGFGDTWEALLSNYGAKNLREGWEREDRERMERGFDEVTDQDIEDRAVAARLDGCGLGDRLVPAVKRMVFGSLRFAWIRAALNGWALHTEDRERQSARVSYC